VHPHPCATGKVEGFSSPQPHPGSWGWGNHLVARTLPKPRLGSNHITTPFSVLDRPPALTLELPLGPRLLGGSAPSLLCAGPGCAAERWTWEGCSLRATRPLSSVALFEEGFSGTTFFEVDTCSAPRDAWGEGRVPAPSTAHVSSLRRASSSSDGQRRLLKHTTRVARAEVGRHDATNVGALTGRFHAVAISSDAQNKLGR
jgi:hypothetical protein